MKGFMNRRFNFACSLIFTVFTALGAPLETASNSFTVKLPPPAAASNLLLNSPFGINTAFNPATADLDARLEAMQKAGIKWGRQDFTWRRIERRKSEYDWEPYDQLVEKCHSKGLLLFGNFTSNPEFYDTRTEEAAVAYANFAGRAAKRYAGKVDHW